jgi:hypothetical protein
VEKREGEGGGGAQGDFSQCSIWGMGGRWGGGLKDESDHILRKLRENIPYNNLSSYTCTVQ